MDGMILFALSLRSLDGDIWYNIEKDDYEKQAQRYAEILRMLLELKKSGRINITSITFFGLIDEY